MDEELNAPVMPLERLKARIRLERVCGSDVGRITRADRVERS